MASRVRRSALCGAMFTFFSAGGAVAAPTPVAGEEDIVVTARRVDERLQDVPLAITAVSAAALSRRSISEIRDLNALAPSLNITQHNNNPTAVIISLRGQTQAGIQLTNDSSVGLYSDGINVPRSVGARGALVDIERIEVLRGPQGTLYGRNTTGGAVSVITKSPTDRLEGSVKASIGNHGAFNGTATLNVPLTDNVASRFVVQRGFHNGYGRNGLGRDLDDENSFFARAKIRGEWGAFHAELLGEISRFRQGGAMVRVTGVVPGATLATRQIAAELGLPLVASPSPAFLVGNPATPAALASASNALQSLVYGNGSTYRNTSDVRSFAKARGRNLALNMQLELSDQLTLRSLTGYRHRTNRSVEDGDGTQFDLVTTFFRTDTNFYSQEFQLLGDYGRLNFVSGLYGSYEDGFENTSNTSVPRVLASSTSNFAGDVTNKSAGVFAQVNFNITDELRLTGGGRYSTEKKRLVSQSTTGTGACLVPAALQDTLGICRGTLRKTDSAPSWLVSLDYKVDDVLLYAKAAHGFRAGGHNIRGSQTLASFEPFDPESVTEYEAGFKVSLFDRRLSFDFAAFHDNYKDIQRSVVVITETGVPATIVTNAARATINGFEGEASLRLGSRLLLQGTFGYIDPKYKRFIDATGDRSNEDWPTPKWTYSMSGRYTVPSEYGDLALQLDYSGQSRQNLYPSGVRTADTTQNAYGLFNGRVSLTTKDGLELALYSRNLAGKKYSISALVLESVGYNIRYLGAPRTVGMEITKKF